MSKYKSGGKFNTEQNQATTDSIQNLTALRMIDPFIEKILTAASHVVFYEFNTALNQWFLKDVQGSLFVVKRTLQPQFQFMVVDRRNADVLVESFLEIGFDIEVDVPYLLYRNVKLDINGIRFNDEGECEEVASVFTRILDDYSRLSQQKMISLSKAKWFCDGWMAPWNYSAPTKVLMEDPLKTTSSSAASDGGDIDEPEEQDATFAHFFSADLDLEGRIPWPYRIKRFVIDVFFWAKKNPS